MTGRTFSFQLRRTSTAPPATLFRMETDGPSWAKWGKPLILQASWDREGVPAPAGVGAIRKVGMWPVLMREETLVYEPDRKHVYTFAGSGPAKDYRAEVLFTPNASGGTELIWSGSFTEGLRGTGPAVRAALRGALVLLSRQLVAAAERETSSGATA
ncbi:SRPBCC family protein [Mycolicibacterium arenosum]|uniref:SRPBCC family protein n=1 Tax=Mycolicibacterium arenosum TaxID=2952157 RepID=A0ABT1MA84_9MYCO|nr:SRPBCC family protein [Mycolicibacterium sp. CAU 1645]MCP9274707.1 SRPBCC family protein [Mycolicibacterium sp. CAU 1645]